jgi:hypothetical protein
MKQLQSSLHANDAVSLYVTAGHLYSDPKVTKVSPQRMVKLPR